MYGFYSYLIDLILNIIFGYLCKLSSHLCPFVTVIYIFQYNTWFIMSAVHCYYRNESRWWVKILFCAFYILKYLSILCISLQYVAICQPFRSFMLYIWFFLFLVQRNHHQRGTSQVGKWIESPQTSLVYSSSLRPQTVASVVSPSLSLSSKPVEWTVSRSYQYWPVSVSPLPLNFFRHDSWYYHK